MKNPNQTLKNLFNHYIPTLEEVEEAFNMQLEKEIAPCSCIHCEEDDNVIDI